MRFFLLFLVTISFAEAQTNQYLSRLQAGLLEEEVNRNLPQAIAIYSNIVAEADAERATIANAIFRLAETHRKSGDTNEAVAAYNKLLHEYSDQYSLRSLSETNLAMLGIAVSRLISEPDNEKDEIENISQLLKASPDVVLNGNYFYSAIGESKPGLALFLIKNGVPVNGMERNPYAPIHLASHLGDLYMVKLLLTNGASVHLKTSDGDFLYPRPKSANHIVSANETPLHLAAAQGHLTICELLLKSGAQMANEGITPLHRAARGGHLQVCKLLVSAGAAVNALSSEKETPLSWSLQPRVEAVPRFLLEKGAKIEIAMLGGESLLGKAAESYPDLLPLLLQQNPDLNQSPAKVPPIRTAATTRSGNYRGLELLLKAGADPNTKGDDGATALHACVVRRPQFRRLEPIEMLLKFKADPNAMDNNGRTPLHYAVLLKDLDCITLLLKAGANPLLKDKFETSPLNYVERNMFHGGRPTEKDIGNLGADRSGGPPYPADIGKPIIEAAKKIQEANN